jgi:hypothetical protein
MAKRRACVERRRPRHCEARFPWPSSTTTLFEFFSGLLRVKGSSRSVSLKFLMRELPPGILPQRFLDF